MIGYGTPDQPRASMRVLLVDDQAEVRKWVRSLLMRMGISDVTEASDGNRALAYVTEPGRTFDLILCDLQMPGRDGIETLRDMAALGLDAAVAITSMEDERVIEAASKLGGMVGLRMLGSMKKPATVEKLEALLSRMLRPVTPRENEPITVRSEDLSDAFARNEFTMLYQPQVRLRTGEFVGVEALVRWKHPTRGLLAPGAFLPMVDESDELTGALTTLAMRESIACAVRSRTAGRAISVAINMSARALDRLDFPERLEALCQAAQLPAESVTLELTETQVARDPARMIDVATRLRLKRFSLSVDDFGTGQSGLSLLQQLPFSEIKIDRQFVHGCSTSASQRSVVEASLGLARSLKMVSVAEGIEKRADWDLLRDLGCDLMQGYFVARPMSENGLEAWAQSRPGIA